MGAAFQAQIQFDNEAGARGNGCCLETRRIQQANGPEDARSLAKIHVGRSEGLGPAVRGDGFTRAGVQSHSAALKQNRPVA